MSFSKLIQGDLGILYYIGKRFAVADIHITAFDSTELGYYYGSIVHYDIPSTSKYSGLIDAGFVNMIASDHIPNYYTLFITDEGKRQSINYYKFKEL